MNHDTVQLNSPFIINDNVTIKNRLFKSAMSEQLATADHNPTQQLVNLYRTWAEGGLGLSITGNIMIDREALGEPKNVVLDEHSDLSVFKEWAKAGATNNTHIWPQLNHPGKQIPSFICKEPVAPSAVALENGLEKGFNTPRALTDSEIETIIAKFATSAELAKQAGFTGVQIHSAHGYLLNQFLSPRHNKRADKWGGSIENRMRFVVCIYQAIREKVGAHFPVGIKLNSADFMKGGFSEEDSMAVIEKLSEIGIDLIEISGGTYESPAMIGQSQSTQNREAYFLSYAEKLRKISKTPLVVTGGFRSAQVMAQALQEDVTDFIGLARPLAVEPDLANKLLSDSNYRIDLRPLSTGITAIDKLVMINVSWYEEQLSRIGNGKIPKPNLSEWISVFKTLYSSGRYAFKKRRA